ncbi:MAG: inorganic phosphate transporter, PiT family [Methanosarcinales archaeon]|nr:inorganic phosphate transporter, PiT family [Methanosarcinales archaeon]
MVGAEVVIGAIIFLALIFDFLNGFHDAANAIATVVATRVLTPLQAVGLAATFNLLGPLVFTTAVAKTVGRGIVVPDVITLSVLAATLIGAISWNLITWWFGLPISSSHSLIGGLIGAAVAANGWGVVYLPSTSLLASLLFYSLLAVAVCCVGWLTIHKVLHIDISNRTVLIGVLLGFAVGIPMITLTGRIPVGGISAVVLFMAVAPILGLCGGFFVASLVIRLFRRYTAETMNKYFRRLQLVSASFYSLTHGANDAQKTMGIITLAVFTGNDTLVRGACVGHPKRIWSHGSGHILWWMAHRGNDGKEGHKAQAISGILCREHWGDGARPHGSVWYPREHHTGDLGLHHGSGDDQEPNIGEMGRGKADSGGMDTHNTSGSSGGCPCRVHNLDTVLNLLSRMSDNVSHLTQYEL